MPPHFRPSCVRQRPTGMCNFTPYDTVDSRVFSYAHHRACTQSLSQASLGSQLPLSTTCSATPIARARGRVPHTFSHQPLSSDAFGIASDGQGSALPAESLSLSTTTAATSRPPVGHIPKLASQSKLCVFVRSGGFLDFGQFSLLVEDRVPMLEVKLGIQLLGVPWHSAC